MRDDHRAIVRAGDDGLVFGPEVVSDLRVVTLLLQERDGLVVADTREGLLNRLELAQVALERLELFASALEDALDDVDEEVLREVHVALEVHERDLRFDHPELGEVPPGLALLGAEGGPEAIHLAERSTGGLHVELPTLREERRRPVVVGLEEVRGPFTSVRCEDRCVHQRESAVVEVGADGRHDLGAYAQDRVLSLAPQPQVTVVHQEVDAVFLGRDGVLLGRDPDDLERLHLQLVLALAFRVRLHGPGDHQRGLLGQRARLLEEGGAHVSLGDDPLDHPGAVTDLEELDLLAAAPVVEPTPERDLLADVLCQIFDVDVLAHDARTIVFGRKETSSLDCVGVFSGLSARDGRHRGRRSDAAPARAG